MLSTLGPFSRPLPEVRGTRGTSFIRSDSAWIAPRFQASKSRPRLSCLGLSRDGMGAVDILSSSEVDDPRLTLWVVAAAGGDVGAPVTLGTLGTLTGHRGRSLGL